MHWQEPAESFTEKLTQEQFNKKFLHQQELDSGAQGTVYSALMKDGMKVAIKKYKKKHVDLNYNEIIREISNLKLLNHPNILKFIGCFVVDSNYYLISEFCEMGTLTSLLKQKRLSENDKISISLQLAEGISHSHASKIIHRDLKPDNIFLGKNLVVKIGDYGCSKKLKDVQEIDFGHTMCKGTPLYMDFTMGTGQYTDKIDIYSLGLIYIEIWTGRHLFFGCQNKADIEAMRKRFNQKFQENVQKLAVKNQVIKDIIAGCLREKEQKRLSSSQLLEKFKKLEVEVKNLSKIHTTADSNDENEDLVLQDMDENELFIAKLLSHLKTNESSKQAVNAEEKLFQILSENRKVLNDLLALEKIIGVDCERNNFCFIVLFYFNFWNNEMLSLLDQQPSQLQELYKHIDVGLLDEKSIEDAKNFLQAQINRTKKIYQKVGKEVYKDSKISNRNKYKPDRYEEMSKGIAQTGHANYKSFQQKDLKKAVVEMFDKRFEAEYRKNKKNIPSQQLEILRRIPSYLV